MPILEITTLKAKTPPYNDSYTEQHVTQISVKNWKK